MNLSLNRRGAMIGMLILIAALSYAVFEGGEVEIFQATPAFAEMADVGDKKAAFFAFIRDNVNEVNLEIQQERALFADLKAAFDTGGALRSGQRRELEALLKRYRMSDFRDGHEADWKELQSRVDVVPDSLVLAQAANESAWGTSRFAVEANNFFGEWCFESGCGLVPAKRGKGETHEVKRFPNARGSVRSYVRNLNTNRAYEEFRKMRSDARALGQALSGAALAGGLIKYSSRGQAYVEEVRSMIRVNHLEDEAIAGGS